MNSFLLLLVASPFLFIGAQHDGRAERSATETNSTFEASFTLQRLGPEIANKIASVFLGPLSDEFNDAFSVFLGTLSDGFNDAFCDGVDVPGNITLHAFYRCRDENDVIGEWQFLQRDSVQLGTLCAALCEA